MFIKLQYDERTCSLIQSMATQLSVGFEVDTRFLDFHNDSCPRCSLQMKSGPFVEEVGTVSAYIPVGTKKAILYCICRECYSQFESLKQKSILFQKSKFTTETERSIAKILNLSA